MPNITSILASDNVGNSRTTINDNFTVADPRQQSFRFQPTLQASAAAIYADGISLLAQGTLSNVTDSTTGLLTANYASVATAGNNFGLVSNALNGINGLTGFWITLKVRFPDASYGSGATGSRFFLGLAAIGAGTVMAADDPATENVGFQFSTNRSDANFQLARRNTSQVLVNTGVAFVAQKEYEFGLRLSPSGTSLDYRIRNITDNGTLASGSVNTQLPTAATQLLLYCLGRTLDNVARNIGIISGSGNILKIS